MGNQVDKNTSTEQDVGPSGNSKRKKITPNHYLTFIMIVSTFGGLLFGYDTGVINGALPFMSKPGELDLGSFMQGLVASSLVLGAAFGAIAGGVFSDSFGRKTAIRYIAVLFIIATLFSALAPTALTMIIARFFLGIAVGGASVTVQTYLSEIATVERRSRMVTQNELMIVTGQFLAYSINAVLALTVISGNDAVWRYMLSVAAIPAIILLIGMFFVPESPRWLISKGKFSEGKKVLQEVRSDERATDELNKIKNSMEQDEKKEKASMKDLFRVKWIRNIVFVGIGIAVMQQVTGVNSIMYYGTEILKDAGFGTNAALIGNIANGAISVIATATGIWLLGHFSHRKMLIFGQIGVVCVLFLLGLTTLLFEGTAMLPYLVLTLTICFLAFMQGTISPTTWLLLSEIFPMKVRGIGMGVCVFFNWITNFLISLSFPVALDYIGLSSTFFIFVALNLAAIAFSKKYVPETRGRSLEELEQAFRTHSEHGVHGASKKIV